MYSEDCVQLLAPKHNHFYNFQNSLKCMTNIPPVKKTDEFTFYLPKTHYK